MSNTNFEKGDIVKLKSGSPLMTISEIVISIRTKKPNGIIKCQWFENETLKFAEFNAEVLERIN